ncbi:MAG: transcriptional repressor [Sediminicola sp.]
MEALEKKLERNGVRVTAMRLLVLQFLSGRKRAVSLTDLENNFEKSDRTTLYRTLLTYVRNGIAHKIDDGTGIAKYALCADDCRCQIDLDLHVHFHCNLCNGTFCLPRHKIPTISLPESFVSEEINLVVKGVCPHCAA